MKNSGKICTLFSTLLLASCAGTGTNSGANTISTGTTVVVSDTNTTTPVKTTVTSAPPPSELETKATQAYQDARKEAKKATSKAATKK